MLYHIIITHCACCKIFWKRTKIGYAYYLMAAIAVPWPLQSYHCGGTSASIVVHRQQPRRVQVVFPFFILTQFPPSKISRGIILSQKLLEQKGNALKGINFHLFKISPSNLFAGNKEYMFTLFARRSSTLRQVIDNGQ